jgi:MFS family permease
MATSNWGKSGMKNKSLSSTSQSSQQIPRNVCIFGLVSLLTDISSEMIYSLLPLFLVSVLNASVLTVGVIEGIAEATASLSKLISGVISDYSHQRKSLVVLGYGLSALVKPLFAIASSPAWVLVARFSDRVGKGIRGAPRDAMIADETPAAVRGAAYGLRQSLDTLGAFLAPLLAFGLMAVSANNFRFVFGCAIIPGVFSVLLLIYGVHEATPRQQSRQRSELPSHEGRGLTALSHLSRPYWTLVTVAFVFNLGNSSNAFLLLRATQLGIGERWVPLTLLVMNFTYFLSAYPAGILSDRWGRVKLLFTALLLYAAIYFGFAVAQTQWHIWGLFALYGLQLGMAEGVLSALVADRVPAQLRGTAFGGLQLATGIALLSASLLTGLLWQQFSPPLAFGLGGFLALGAALLLMVTDTLLPARHSI